MEEKCTVDVSQLVNTDKYDRHNHGREHMKSLSCRRVYLATSNVCPGRGVFAAHDMPKNTPLTAYAGSYKQCSKGNKKDNNEASKIGNAYEYVIDCDDYEIDGSKAGDSWWNTYGVAQYANDALHPDVSGFSNNCDFKEFRVYIGKMSHFAQGQHDPQNWRPRIFLVANRDIIRGEELLVSYGLPYWMNMKNKSEHWAREKYGDNLYEWVMCQNKSQDFLRQHIHKKAEIIEYRNCMQYSEDNIYMYGKYRFVVEFPLKKRPCCSSHVSGRLCKLDLFFQKHRDEFYENESFDTIPEKYNQVSPNAVMVNVCCGLCHRNLHSSELRY